MSEGNAPISADTSSSQATQPAQSASSSQPQIDIVKQCERIIEKYHLGQTDKTDAIISLIHIVPGSTVSGSPGFHAFAQYLAQLEEEDRRNQTSAERGRQPPASANSSCPGQSQSSTDPTDSNRPGTSTDPTDSNGSGASTSFVPHSSGKDKQPASHTFIRAHSPDAEEGGVKRVKIDDAYLPWIDRDVTTDQRDTDRVRQNLDKTRRQLAEF